MYRCGPGSYADAETKQYRQVVKSTAACKRAGKQVCKTCRRQPASNIVGAVNYTLYLQ